MFWSCLCSLVIFIHISSVIDCSDFLGFSVSSALILMSSDYLDNLLFTSPGTWSSFLNYHKRPSFVSRSHWFHFVLCQILILVSCVVPACPHAQFGFTFMPNLLFLFSFFCKLLHSEFMYTAFLRYLSFNSIKCIIFLNLPAFRASSAFGSSPLLLCDSLWINILLNLGASGGTEWAESQWQDCWLDSCYWLMPCIQLQSH